MKEFSRNSTNLGALGFELGYDPAVLEVQDVILTPFLGATSDGPSGRGSLAEVVFTTKDVGAAGLTLVPSAWLTSAAWTIGKEAALAEATSGGVLTYTLTVSNDTAAGTAQE